MEPAFGIASGVVGVVAIVPYIRDTVRGSTRPQRFSWLIWCVLALVVLGSQRADGASWSLMIVVAHLVVTLAVLLLAIRHGVGGGTPIDWALLAFAGVGVAGWQLAGEPSIATACVILADATALAIMLPKTYRDPYSETLVSYVLGAVASLLALGAVGSLDVSLLAYPVYLALAGGLLSLAIFARRRQLGPRAGAGALVR